MKPIEVKQLYQADFDYWILRADYEMPQPDPRTLINLGRAAYLLTKYEEKEDE